MKEETPLTLFLLFIMAVMTIGLVYIITDSIFCYTDECKERRAKIESERQIEYETCSPYLDKSAGETPNKCTLWIKYNTQKYRPL